MNNMKFPDIHSDEDGSTLGIDMLLNPRKLNTNVMSDTMSVKSQRVLDLGRQSGFEDEVSDIEVVSTKSESVESPVHRQPEPQLFRQTKHTLSEISSESGWKPKQNQYSNEDILNMKRELLYQFSRLEKRGVNVPKKFTLASSLEEMKTEYERLKRDKEVEASIRFQRKMLMACVTGVEFLNTKFDPFDVKLDGWSGEMSENIQDYDDVFEELYDKYKGKAKMAPELRLLFMVGGSAVWFHISNSMFKTSLPGLDQVLRQNPELKKQFAQATMRTMAQENEGTAAGSFGGLMSMFGGFGGDGASPPPQDDMRRHMRGPTNVDDLLHELKEERYNQAEKIEVLSQTGTDLTVDAGDDVSISSMLKTKRKRRTLEI